MSSFTLHRMPTVLNYVNIQLPLLSNWPKKVTNEQILLTKKKLHYEALSFLAYYGIHIPVETKFSQLETIANMLQIE